MEQIGIVKSIDNNIATVKVIRKSMCGDNCASCKGACKEPTIEIKADAYEGIQVGDQVDVMSSSDELLKYSIILYGVPLVVMVGTLFIIYALLKSNPNVELYAGIGSLLSLFLSSFILKKYDIKESKEKNIRFIISKKID